jgi:DNA-binding MarR family transcriptional regulator
MATSHPPAYALAQVLGPLRRALLRATQDAGDLPYLPEAQIEVLRLLIETGPISSARTAARLGLARPTVSNLLKTMTSAGLIDRTAAAEDLRSTLVSASDAARGLLARYDDVSARVVAAALGQLDTTAQERLRQATGPLRELTEIVARSSPALGVGPGAGGGSPAKRPTQE